MLASKDDYDHRLVREALQVTVEQGRLREGNGRYMVANGSDT